MRAALRMHFRLLINKPVHHDALFALLSGSRPNSAGAAPQLQMRFGFRVLIVEDNVINQRLSERVLMRLGCTAVIARDGREGVAVLRERAADFDLVLLDLHMPEMDGITALREIRSGNAGPRAQTMWIIALTADVREQQRKRAMDAGLNEYLTKPLNIAELEAALRRYRTERLARKR
jgi:CheY-like chemotaxis protein